MGRFTCDYRKIRAGVWKVILILAILAAAILVIRSAYPARTPVLPDINSIGIVILVVEEQQNKLIVIRHKGSFRIGELVKINKVEDDDMKRKTKEVDENDIDEILFEGK